MPSTQDCLVALDALDQDGPATTDEIAAFLDADAEPVRERLRAMADAGQVEHSGDGWRALVAPELDPEVAAELDEREGEAFVALDDYE